MKRKIDESAIDDYRAEDRYQRLTRGSFYSRPSNEDLERQAEMRKYFGKGSPRPEDTGLNRTERRRRDTRSTEAPWSLNDYDREDRGEEYRTDLTSVGGLGGSYNMAEKIRGHLLNLFYGIGDFCDDPSIYISLKNSVNPVLKKILSMNPDEVTERLENIKDSASSLFDDAGEALDWLESRRGQRNRFNKAADRRRLPESREVPFGGMSISQMNLLRLFEDAN